MAIGEVFLGAFLQVLFDRLASPSLIGLVNQFGGISSDQIKKWKRKLKTMEGVLVDAEEKQFTDSGVKEWLDDVHDLSYDMEDLLDKLETEALEHKLKAEDDRSETSSMIQSFIPTCFSSFKLHDCVEDITSRLDDLFEQKNELGLVKIVGGTSPSSITTSHRPPSMCLPSELTVVGRDEDKKIILDIVLNHDSDSRGLSFQVIPIVGIGGIGKTTLAQAVYNDHNTMRQFNMRAWVCISQDFDLLRISKAILEAITFSPCDLKNLNQVQLKLKENIDGKKFLFVLDDVWDHKYGLWKALRPPFMAGAPGSKIIVTTRIKEVGSMMGPIQCYDLAQLSDGDCWSIFKEHVLLNRNHGVYGNLEVIRDKVVEWSKGLPLAAQSLGGLLRHKERREWDGILNSNIWDLTSYDCDILPLLKLSYQHLPSHLKRCFAYCAIFPEDYQFDEKELILLWMAEGFVPESKYNKQMEDCGRDYFHDLLSRSFFKPSNTDSSKYTMHDRLNDLARWISRDTSFRFEVGSKIHWEKFRRVRHSSVSCHQHDGGKIIKLLSEAKRLSTILLCSPVNLDLLPKMIQLRVLSLKGCYVTELPNSVGDLKHLRALILAGTWIKCLPESTCSLYNLQTLDLKDCHNLDQLPSKMENLINLRYLDIRGANFILEMPVGVKELKHLRTLWRFDVSKNERGLGLKDLKNMKSLRELNISKLENSSAENIAVLGEMKDLKVLMLAWSHQSDDHSEDEKVIEMLQPYTNLEELKVEGYSGSYFPSWIEMLQKLENLKIGLCCNLKSLWHDDLSLRKSPNEVHSLTSLRRLEIFGCDALISLLEGIEYAHLEYLEIKYCDSLRFVFKGKPPPSLKRLSITSCKKLKSLLDDEEDAHTLSCPCSSTEIQIEKANRSVTLLLEWLEIFSCESLKYVFRSKIPAYIKYLKISYCKELKCLLDDEKDVCTSYCTERQKEHAICNFTSILEYLYLSNCQSLTRLSSSGKTFLPNALKHLEIRLCRELTLLTPKGQLPKALEQLKVLSCLKLETIAERVHNDGSLEVIEIFGCENLKGLPDGLCNLSHLRKIHVRECSSLVWFPERGLPNTVSSVSIWSCPKLKALPHGIHGLNSPEYLSKKGCPSITYNIAEEGFPTNLTELGLEGDLSTYKPLIEWGLHRLTSLKRLEIYKCKDVVSFPVEEMSMTLSPSVTELEIRDLPKLEYLSSLGFRNLTSLELLSIENCPNLASFSEEDLPSSLQKLLVLFCPVLERNCREDGGPEWHKIANIPTVLFLS